MFLECKPNDAAAPLRSRMVEFQDHYVVFPTADTGGPAKVVQHEPKVALLD
jgi:hypothetical protein